MMLNPFPIMWLSMLAYTILRMVVGATVLHFGMTHYKHRHELSITFKHFINIIPFSAAVLLSVVEMIIGVMIILGWHTQYACLIGIAIAIKLLVLYKKIPSPYLPSRSYLILLIGALLSLFITGAGAFAFDLPL